jgi:hypothetical protein
MRTFAAGWAEPELKVTADRWGDAYGKSRQKGSWLTA